MPESFRCTVVTPEAEFLDREVTYASIPAWDGELGVQHLRAPLVVKLGYGPLRLELPNGQAEQVFIGGGFAQIKQNVLAILTDEAAEPSSLNANDAQQALEKLNEQTTSSDDEQAEKEKQLARLQGILATIS